MRRDCPPRHTGTAQARRLIGARLSEPVTVPNRNPCHGREPVGAVACPLSAHERRSLAADRPQRRIGTPQGGRLPCRLRRTVPHSCRERLPTWAAKSQARKPLPNPSARFPVARRRMDGEWLRRLPEPRNLAAPVGAVALPDAWAANSCRIDCPPRHTGTAQARGEGGTGANRAAHRNARAGGCGAFPANRSAPLPNLSADRNGEPLPRIRAAHLSADRTAHGCGRSARTVPNLSPPEPARMVAG